MFITAESLYFNNYIDLSICIENKKLQIYINLLQ